MEIVDLAPLAIQGILDAMPDMLRVISPEHRVVLINKSYAERFGEQLGRPCYDMFCAGEACKNCIVDRTMGSGESEDKRRRYGGRAYWVKASPLFDSSGKPVGAVEVFRDITELEAQERSLREQNKRLLQEADLAARLQRALFLQDLTLDRRVRVHSRYLPASSVGGDLFGCFLKGPDRLCFYVADVAGHGMAAAMTTLLLATALQNARDSAGGPAELLSRARHAFLKLFQEPDAQRYVTMFVGELALDTGRLLFANAGHNAEPLLIADGKVERLTAAGLPICDWFDEIRYEQRETHMPPGGRLLIYTDGLIDPYSSTLDEDRLAECVRLGAGEALLNRLEEHVLPNRRDDVCMLLVSRDPDVDEYVTHLKIS